MFLHALHIHLQSGEEHDIVKSHSSKQFKRVVTLKNIEAILSDHHTSQHHADDMRNTQFTHHDRCEEDNQ